LIENIDANKKFQKELNSGTAALVLLSLLDQAKEPMYGYQIAKFMENADGMVPIMKLGAFYPVLRSLETGGLLASHVDPSVSGPPRRYYRITDNGRATLGSWVNLWNRTRDFVDNILRGRTDG
jgi:PadR family transcriptional regulator PadR